MRAGKKEGVLGVLCPQEFLPARPVWGGKRFRNSALAEYQNRKIFISLIEKILGGAQLKNVKKIFLLCSPNRSGGERKRWAGLPPVGRQSKVAVRIFVKKSSDFNQKAPPLLKIRILGDFCLAPPEAGLGFHQNFEGIFEIQKQFLPAQTEVRFAEGKHKFEKFINQSFFLSPSAKDKAII